MKLDAIKITTLLVSRGTQSTDRAKKAQKNDVASVQDET
jgi:hypothetical protein